MYMNVLHTYMCVWPMYVPVAHGGQKKTSDGLELELQTIANCLWVLETKSLSSKGTSAFNSWANLPKRDVKI